MIRCEDRTVPVSNRKVQVYEDLANWEHRQGSPQARDRFLILAADAALEAGLNDEAERLRARLLEHNPHHMLRPYSSLADAMKSADVHSYVADLRGTYPVEEAEKLLGALQGDKQPVESSPAPTPPQPPLPELPPPAEVLRGLPSEGTGPAEPVGPEGEEPSPFGSLRGPAAATAPLSRKTPRPVEPEPEDEEAEERPSGIGVLFSDALFFLLLLAGVVLIGYTLARPFLSLPDAPFK